MLLQSDSAQSKEAFFSACMKYLKLGGHSCGIYISSVITFVELDMHAV